MFHFARLIAALAAATLMAGTAGAQTVLRSSDTHPDGYPTVEAVKYFGQLLDERTQGRYKVEVYFGAQLGQEADTIEQVRSA
jgi:TRAP-type C4-dicarboxylate transport system substrate-binding protein